MGVRLDIFGSLTFRGFRLILENMMSESKERGVRRPAPASGDTVPGIEVLIEEHIDPLRGRRVGLLTHAAAVARDLRSSIRILHDDPGIDLAVLFAPEHGLWGCAQAGEPVDSVRDPGTGLPVRSFYRDVANLPPSAAEDADARMRELDTQDEGKHPEPDGLRDIDLLVVDLQDVGTRVYTYAATMAYALQAGARAGLPVTVLDRPNPLGGVILEGPILDPELRSFVGAFDVPLRHGLTMGELARLAASDMDPAPDLTVIPMRGWKRDMTFEDTGLIWVPPSPNLPVPDSARVYPGQVLLEGSNLSEGRGTTRPFELFGAPWMDGAAAADYLNRLDIPGARFRESRFTPEFSKHRGLCCGGCRIHVVEPEKLRPVTLTLNIIRWALDRYPQRFEFHAEYFDRACGSRDLRRFLEQGRSVESIVVEWAGELEAFRRDRQEVLLY